MMSVCYASLHESLSMMSRHSTNEWQTLLIIIKQWIISFFNSSQLFVVSVTLSFSSDCTFSRMASWNIQWCQTIDVNRGKKIEKLFFFFEKNSIRFRWEKNFLVRKFSHFFFIPLDHRIWLVIGSKQTSICLLDIYFSSLILTCPSYILVDVSIFSSSTWRFALIMYEISSSIDHEFWLY